MGSKPLKMFKVNSLSDVRDIDALYCVKTPTDTEFTIVVTDAFGTIVNLKDLQTPAGIQGIASDDGTIEVTGANFKNLRLSATLVNAINNALKAGDNISELVNDAGYLTSFTETDPIFQASEASLFVAGDKANLDNQSNVNTGDETTSSIQSKRPIKTVDSKSLEGTGNIEIDYNTVINKPISFPPSTHSHVISDVTGLQTTLDILTENSAGAISGFAITNNGNETVNIASGVALLRATASEVGVLSKYNISGVTNVALTDNINNYVIVQYNAGSPNIAVVTDSNLITTTNNTLIYVISRYGNVLNYLYTGEQNVDSNGKLRRRFLNVEPIKRAGGAVLGFTNRTINTTAGLFYGGLTPYTTPLLNTFTNAYNNGSVWTRQTAQTQLNNTQYNVNGVLTSMTNGRFRTDFVYIMVNNPSVLYTIMGTAQYNTLAGARLALKPSVLPVELQRLGVLVGRVIIGTNDASITESASAYDEVFAASTVINHNDTANLQGGAVGDYQHVTTAEKVTWNGKQNALGFTPENIANKNQVNGYAGLDSGGKINPLQLPALAITDTFVVNSQVEQLALIAEIGDVAVRTDLNKSFILRVADASILANWQELLTPVSVDQTIIDGSTNAVSGNAVFDGLALKSNLSGGNTFTGSQTIVSGTLYAPYIYSENVVAFQNGVGLAWDGNGTSSYLRGIRNDKVHTDLKMESTGFIKTSAQSTNILLAGGTDIPQSTFALAATAHNPVTLGTANGLSLATQVLSLGLAGSGSNGALSSTDWNTFNNKQNALTNPVTGTGVSGQISFWNGTNSQTGDSGLFWNNSTKRLQLLTSDSRLEGGDSVGRLILSNSTTTGYIEIGGATRPTSPSYVSLITTSGIINFFTNSVERARFNNAGRFLLGQTTDNLTDILQINGSAAAAQYKLNALNTAPSTATSTGILGEIRVTATHIYVCTATNTWVRSALTTW